MTYERQCAAAVKAWLKTNTPEFTACAYTAFEGLCPCVDAGKGDAAHVMTHCRPMDRIIEIIFTCHIAMTTHCDHRDVDTMAV